MLEIRDLHVRFRNRDREAVAGVSFSIGEGEIVGLVGESGSGKTVTAMSVAGLLPRKQCEYAGEILLDGAELLHADRKDSARIFALFPGQEARHAHGGDGLSGAGLAHQAHDLPFSNGKADPGHGFPVPVQKPHMEVLNFQHHSTPLSRRRRPSPKRPTLNTSSTMTSPVPAAYHGAAKSIPWASESM